MHAWHTDMWLSADIQNIQMVEGTNETRVAHTWHHINGSERCEKKNLEWNFWRRRRRWFSAKAQRSAFGVCLCVCVWVCLEIFLSVVCSFICFRFYFAMPFCHCSATWIIRWLRWRQLETTHFFFVHLLSLFLFLSLCPYCCFGIGTRWHLHGCWR